MFAAIYFVILFMLFKSTESNNWLSTESNNWLLSSTASVECDLSHCQSYGLKLKSPDIPCPVSGCTSEVCCVYLCSSIQDKDTFCNDASDNFVFNYDDNDEECCVGYYGTCQKAADVGVAPSTCCIAKHAKSDKEMVSTTTALANMTIARTATGDNTEERATRIKQIAEFKYVTDKQMQFRHFEPLEHQMSRVRRVVFQNKIRIDKADLKQNVLQKLNQHIVKDIDIAFSPMTMDDDASCVNVDCCTYDLSNDKASGVTTMLVIGDSQNDWGVVCNGTDILVKQTRNSADSYKMSCWVDNQWLDNDTSYTTGNSYPCNNIEFIVGPLINNGDIAACDTLSDTSEPPLSTVCTIGTDLYSGLLIENPGDAFCSSSQCGADDAPTCCITQYSCMELFSTPNAKAPVGVEGGTPSGTSVPYECNPGYTASNTTAACNAGSWDTPTCDPSPCYAVINGLSEASNIQQTPGTTVPYECEPGYTASVGVMTCTAGNWDIPTCNPDSCVAPFQTPNGLAPVGIAFGTPSGLSVQYECNPGYTGSAATVSCYAGSWGTMQEPRISPTCNPNTCTPTLFEGSQERLVGGTGESRTVVCEHGYTTSSTGVCLSDGSWELNHISANVAMIYTTNPNSVEVSLNNVVACEGDQITITFEGRHNIEAVTENNCNAIGEQVVNGDYRNKGEVETFSNLYADPGSTRYFKCGRHCAIFSVSCPPEPVACTPRECTPSEVANSNKATTGSITGNFRDSVTVKCDPGYYGGGTVYCGETLLFGNVECILAPSTSTRLEKLTLIKNAAKLNRLAAAATVNNKYKGLLKKQKRERVKASKIFLSKDDLPNLYNPIKEKMKAIIAYVEAEYDPTEIMDCTISEEGSDGIPDCCTYNFETDIDTSVFVGLNNTVGAWSVLCDGALVVSKQNRTTLTNEDTGIAGYDVQCWNGIGFDDVVAKSSGEEHRCGPYRILIGSQANGQWEDTCDVAFTTDNIVEPVGANTTDGGNITFACQSGYVSSGLAFCINGTWDSSTCENIDDCVQHACLHGSLCEDQVESYTCDCDNTGYEGDYCETASQCTVGPNGQACDHNGIVNGTTGNCTCDCANTGYEGDNCETALPCTVGAHGQACQNNGIVNGNTGNCACDCDNTGYGGDNCETVVDNDNSDGSPGNVVCIHPDVTVHVVVGVSVQTVTVGSLNIGDLVVGEGRTSIVQQIEHFDVDDDACVVPSDLCGGNSENVVVSKAHAVRCPSWPHNTWTFCQPHWRRVHTTKYVHVVLESYFDDHLLSGSVVLESWDGYARDKHSIEDACHDQGCPWPHKWSLVGDSRWTRTDLRDILFS